MIIRKEKQSEQKQVENLVREAFWDVYMPGCSEHYLTHLLRQSPIFIPDLSFVAEEGGQLVGMIYYTKAQIKQKDKELSLVSFGPLAVLPDWQKKGIASQLIRYTIELAKSRKIDAIVIYGNPQYYGRFGFEAGEKYGVADSQGNFCDALLVLKLTDKDVDLSGRYMEDDIYHIDNAALKAFDSAFPAKQKHKLPTQLFDGPLD